MELIEILKILKIESKLWFCSYIKSYLYEKIFFLSLKRSFLSHAIANSKYIGVLVHEILQFEWLKI